jgi:hypothetical protein
MKNIHIKLVVEFTEKMKSITHGELRFFIHTCHNGFKQAILEHRVRGYKVAVFMAANEAETDYLVENFKSILKP